MINDQQESIAESSDVDKYKDGSNYKGKGAFTNSVDFNVSYASAEMLGIESLDLKGAMQGTGAGEDVATSTKNYDGTQEHFEDINGSSVINTFGVNFKNGDTITGKETLNTKHNLDTFYGQIAENAGKENGGNAANIRVDVGSVQDDFNNAKGSNKVDGIIDKLEGIQQENQGIMNTVDGLEANQYTDDYIKHITGSKIIADWEYIDKQGAKKVDDLADSLTKDIVMETYDEAKAKDNDAAYNEAYAVANNFFDIEKFQEEENK